MSFAFSNAVVADSLANYSIVLERSTHPKPRKCCNQEASLCDFIDGPTFAWPYLSRKLNCADISAYASCVPC